MAIDIRTSGSVIILDLSDKLTVDQGTEELVSKVKELLGLEVRKIILNLDRIIYLDSTGIDSLLACYHATSETGGQLKFASPSRFVHHLLSMTKLTTVLDVHVNEAKAIGSFR
jgi:anti-anti-sigma factor